VNPWAGLGTVAQFYRFFSHERKDKRVFEKASNYAQHCPRVATGPDRHLLSFLSYDRDEMESLPLSTRQGQHPPTPGSG